MKKNNKNGFVLVETLIVVVFVAAIFSIMFLNFYPLIGEYERRENYDDVESKYGAYWVKKMIQDSNYTVNYNNPHATPFNIYPYTIYRDITCSTIYSDDEEKKSKCEEIYKKLGIEKSILAAYNLTNLKKGIAEFPTSTTGISYGINLIDDNFRDYINYLPNYTHESLNGAKYRILVKFKHDSPTKSDFIGDEDITEYPYYTYATLEVTK